ncbi:MAG: hypothetical protein MR663_03130, partial [Lachnospiraceae bacterium]|nr:hypothetical protein [Lachnospiraceae bacterium]
KLTKEQNILMDRLYKLRMSGMAEAFEKQLLEPNTGLEPFEARFAAIVSDGTLWEGQIALYFRWTCLPDCAVPELDADYRRNNRRLS